MSLSVKNSCGGKSLPELTNPAIASDIASGKQAIDGEGNIIDGNLDEITSGYTFQALIDGSFKNCIYSSVTLGTDMIFRNGSKVAHEIDASKFGDATAADVASGKTFTSAAGLKAVGTGKMMIAEDYDFTNFERKQLTQLVTENKTTITVDFSNYHETILAKFYFNGTDYNHEATLLIIGNVCFLVCGRICAYNDFDSYTVYEAIYSAQIFTVTRSNNSITISLNTTAIPFKYKNGNYINDAICTPTKIGSQVHANTFYGI